VVRVQLGNDGFFRRFRFADADRDQVLRDIAADRAVLAAAIPGAASPAILRALVRLGFSLTPLGHEAEAAAHLEAALTMARLLSAHDQEISALLHLATALQYLGERDRAQLLFQEGLDRAAEYGIDTDVHFLLHHRARCYAEQNKMAEARACMAQALALRQQIGDPRFITSSQDALADLASRG
jgi:tetratricopeptide (TPR) repeat protein